MSLAFHLASPCLTPGGPAAGGEALRIYIYIYIRHRANDPGRARCGVFRGPSWPTCQTCPWGPCRYCILRGQDPGGPRALADHPRLQKFDDFLTSSWYPILSDFSANLTPTYLPTWSQHPPKIKSRAIQNPSLLPSLHRSCVFLFFLFFFIFEGLPEPRTLDFCK